MVGIARAAIASEATAPRNNSRVLLMHLAPRVLVLSVEPNDEPLGEQAFWFFVRHLRDER